MIAEHVITWINDFQMVLAEYGSAQMQWIEDAEIELQHLKRLLTGQRWVEAVEEVASDQCVSSFHSFKPRAVESVKWSISMSTFEPSPDINYSLCNGYAIP